MIVEIHLVLRVRRISNLQIQRQYALKLFYWTIIEELTQFLRILIVILILFNHRLKELNRLAVFFDLLPEHCFLLFVVLLLSILCFHLSDINLSRLWCLDSGTFVNSLVVIVVS